MPPWLRTDWEPSPFCGAFWAERSPRPGRVRRPPPGDSIIATAILTGCSITRRPSTSVRMSYRLKDRRKAGCGPTMCHIPFWPNWKKNRGSQVSERHVSTSSGVWTTNTLSFRDPSVLHGKLGSDPQSGQGRNEIGCQTADGWFRQCYA